MRKTDNLRAHALMMRWREGRAFALTFCALFVVGFGNSMLLAVLPPIARAIALPDRFVGAVFSVSALLWVLTSPYWGRLSDRVGRRPIIALGLWAFALSMGLFAAVAAGGVAGLYGPMPCFFGMAAARAVFGAIGSATAPAAQAYVADTSAPERRLRQLGALTSAFALGSAIGPAFCAALAARFGLIAPIVFTTALAILAGLALNFLLPKSAVPAGIALPDDAGIVPRQGGGNTWRLALDPRVRSYLIYGAGISLAVGVLAQTFAFYTMDKLAVSGPVGAERAAAGFSAGAMALLATQLLILPRIRMSTRGLMVLGAVLATCSVGLQIAAQDLIGLMASQALQGLAFGLARPGFSSGASLAVQPHEQGALAGLVVAANGAGFVISPLAGNALYEIAGMDAPLWLAIGVLSGLAAFAHFDPGPKQAAISARPPISSPGPE